MVLLVPDAYNSFWSTPLSVQLTLPGLYVAVAAIPPLIEWLSETVKLSTHEKGIPRSHQYSLSQVDPSQQ